MKAADGSLDFAAFYDAAPAGEHEVASLYGAHWRGSGRESIVVVFRDSGTYGPDGSERPQEIRLGNLAHRRALASAIARGFVLLSQDKAPVSRQDSATSLRLFFVFLDQSDPDCGIVEPSQVDTSLAGRYVVWLSQRMTTAKDGSSKPMSRQHKRAAYGALKGTMDALRRDASHDLAVDCSFRKNPWPSSRGMGARRGIPDPSHVLSDGQLRAIWEACRRDIFEATALFDEGERLIAESSARERADGRGFDLKELGGVLAALDQRYGGILPQIERLRIDDPSLYDAVNRHGGKERIRPYLVATPATLLPFVLLLAMRTFFNPDAILGIRDSSCRDTHWLWGSQDWELTPGNLSMEGEEELSKLVADGLPREAATRTVLASYKGRKPGMVTRTFRASSEWDSPSQLVTEVRRITRRLRAAAPEIWRDRLFLFQPARGRQSAPRSFMSKLGPSTDTVFTKAMGRFIERHGLSGFSLRSLRLTGADATWEATGGNPAAVATMLSNQPRTAGAHYCTPGNVRRAEHTLAVMTNRRVRMVESGGRSRIEFTACTPGFHCTDPYDSPVPGQAPGRLCSAYPMCPTCPLASLDRSRPDAVAWLLHLAAGIKEAGSTMEPARYQAVYAPLLAALHGTWLRGMPDSTRSEAETLAAHLPPSAGME